MMAQVSRDWSVFKQLFADHWDEFKLTQTSYDDTLVAKMLGCGNPDKMDYIEYHCEPCGQGQHLVSMSCKSSLCLRCAKVYVDNWVSQVRQVRHEGVIYRHLILTVPAMFRTLFYQNAEVLLSALRRCGAQCLDDFYSEVRGKALKSGYTEVIHTHGGNGQYPPHVHVIARSRGYEAQAESWEHSTFLPYDLLRRKWQWHLITMWRQTLAMDTINDLVDVGFRKYPNGLVTNVQKGPVPSQYQSLASYVAHYVVSAPISVRRIDRYNGHRVTSHDRSDRTERSTYETVDVITFIGRMIQHTRPKGFKRIRYDGVQATKTFAKWKGISRAALAKVEGLAKGAVKIIARLTYRERYEKSTGRDPLICPHCQGEMRLWRLWHPIYGIIYDEARGSNVAYMRQRHNDPDLDKGLGS
jgi:hypothetical protein